MCGEDGAGWADEQDGGGDEGAGQLLLDPQQRDPQCSSICAGVPGDQVGDFQDECGGERGPGQPGDGGEDGDHGLVGDVAGSDGVPLSSGVADGGGEGPRQPDREDGQQECCG